MRFAPVEPFSLLTPLIEGQTMLLRELLDDLFVFVDEMVLMSAYVS
jgi:hypothetical protein